MTSPGQSSSGSEDPTRQSPPGGSAASGSAVPGPPKAPPVPDYELLKRIGQGSYGDVWLARGVTGLYRAVKVVWRERFDSAEPYEREFRGLREFAAFSQKAEGQMALLHIGRNDAAGFFYYVMELADDANAGRLLDPSNYVPLTLKEWRLRRRAVPAPEVIQAGVELATALAALHAAGLVHRDIKPSNAILVNGKAKLADIGLVSAAHQAHTYIGTMGYVPPEGPGSPAADVWALGRVLYELATGLEGDQFPKLPDKLESRADRKELLALNEVLLRASAPVDEGRYADAAGLAADLVALRDGGRLRRRFVRRRRHWAGAVALAVLVAAAVWRWLPSGGAPAPGGQTAAAAPRNVAVDDKSIAVLPFENLDGDKEDARLAAGLLEDVITDLASIRQLRVLAWEETRSYRNTPKTLKQIGRELGVAYLLIGSVRREATVVRLTARLIDARTDVQVWANKFDREVKDILHLQTDLAGEIVPALKVALTPEEKSALTRAPTNSAEAYGLYLEVKQWFAGKGPSLEAEQAEQKMRRAVALDPGFVRAWIALAAVHRLVYAQLLSDTSEARLVMAEQAIAEARRLAPDDPEVMIAEGEVRHYCYKDYAGAIALYRQVLSTHPRYPRAHEYIAYLYRRQGRWTEALAEFREAARDAPADLRLAQICFDNLLHVRRYREAGEWLGEIRRFWPVDRELGYWLAVRSFMLDDSQVELERWYAGIPSAERASEDVDAKRLDWALNVGDEATLLEIMRRRPLRLDELDAASILLFRGERALLEQQLAGIKPALDEDLRRSVASPVSWMRLGKFRALSGDHAEAMVAINRARQLAPESEDAVNGPRFAIEAAEALTWLGEKDAALTLLEHLVKVAHGIHVWDLKYVPTFIPLRDEPRFKAMIADPRNREPLF